MKRVMNKIKEADGVSENLVGGWLEPYLTYIDNKNVTDVNGYPANSTVFFDTLIQWLNSSSTVSSNYADDIVFEASTDRVRTAQMSGSHEACISLLMCDILVSEIWQ